MSNREFRFGIEHEVALVRDGRFVDWTRITFAELDRVVAELPLYPGDYPQLHVGDAGIRRKRWYIEGIERFAESGELFACVPKGIEVRTTLHPEIGGAVGELMASLDLLRAVAARHGLAPVCASFNPERTEFVYDPPLTGFELRQQEESPDLRTDGITMLTYGPDLNLSLRGLSTDRVIDLGRKLTHYSPFLVPWSFGSPFFGGRLWEGLSVRTFVRTGRRAAVHVFVEREDELVASTPALTRRARSASEVGRIEFKAFDSCCDPRDYASLLALLKGVVLDTSLPGRDTVPDGELHRRAARAGFADPHIREGSARVLAAAATALAGDPDVAMLRPLARALHDRVTPADRLRDAYRRSGSVLGALETARPAPTVEG